MIDENMLGFKFSEIISLICKVLYFTSNKLIDVPTIRFRFRSHLIVDRPKRFYAAEERLGHYNQIQNLCGKV